MRKSKEGKYI